MLTIRIGLVMAFCAALAGCSKSEAASNLETTKIEGPPGAHKDTPHYSVSIEPIGTYEKDATSNVRVQLVAKGKYKVNDEYPFRFVSQDPPAEGVSYPKNVLARSDGTFEATRAQFLVPFVAERSGTVKVGGVFSLSVCTPANCLIDKIPLVLDVSIP